MTETTHRIEQKHLPKYTIDSYANFIFASNEDWLVPCDVGERRWFMLRARGTYRRADGGEQSLLRQAAPRGRPHVGSFPV